jgi:hypothetical protein
LKKEKETYVKRSTGEDHPTGRVILCDLFHELAVEVLETVPFVNDDITPTIPGEMDPVANDHLIRGDNDRKIVVEHLIVNHRGVLFIFIHFCLLGLLGLTTFRGSFLGLRDFLCRWLLEF